MISTTKIGFKLDKEKYRRKLFEAFRETETGAEEARPSQEDPGFLQHRRRGSAIWKKCSYGFRECGIVNVQSL